jgi:hypothetical protein
LNRFVKGESKGKFFLVHLLINIKNRRQRWGRWLVSPPVTLSRGNNSLNGSFGELLKRPEHFGEGRNLVFRPRIHSQFFCCPSLSLVNVPTTITPVHIKSSSQVLICWCIGVPTLICGAGTFENPEFCIYLESEHACNMTINRYQVSKWCGS